MTPITGLTLWRSWATVQKASGLNAPGAFRYALKKSLRGLEPHWKDILEFIAEDRAEHGWEAQPNGLPVFPNDFYSRLDEVLARPIEVALHRFDESLLAGVDGLSVNDEANLSFLFLIPEPEPAKAE